MTTPIHHSGPTTPVTVATTVQAPPSPNPLLMLENWTPFMAAIIAVAGIVALFTKHISARLADFKAIHTPVHDVLDRDIKDISHKLANERQRIEALERSRSQDVERIVKLETQFDSILKSHERVEKAVEKIPEEMGHRMDKWAEQLSQSIREIREVKPKL